MSSHNEHSELFVNAEYFKKSSSKPHIVFLHGFTGSSNDWMRILPRIDNNFSKIAVDLPGHGKSPDPPDAKYYSPNELAMQLNLVLEKLDVNKVILLGYSMGGRAALTYTFSHPGKVAGLILESTTAGIESEPGRKERRENDKNLAEYVLQNGIEKFIDYWMDIPLFSSQKKLDSSILADVRKNKLNNSPQGLVNSLTGFGTGSMPSYWDRLKELTMPAQLITGSLDKKYDAINKRMLSLLSKAKHFIIEDAGHNVHLEKVSEFIILVNRFLRIEYY